MPVEYNKSINAMTPGDEIEGYYILKSANPKVAANGKPFLTGALSDRTGTMELKASMTSLFRRMSSFTSSDCT